MNKYSFFIALFFIALGGKTLQAQNTPQDSIPTGKISYEKGKEYILGGITVTGLKKFSEPTVKVFTGLRDGQLVKTSWRQINQRH